MGKVHEGMSGDALEIESGGVVQVRSGGRIHLEQGASLEAGSAKMSGAELAALDGASSTNATEGKAAILGAGGAVTFPGPVTNQVPARTSAGVGAKAGGTLTALEQGDGAIHKTVLTLTSTPITLTDDAGNGQYLGLKVYDFPAGNIAILGAVVDLDLELTETWWVDTIAGDVGVGTAAAANGDALASTEQDIVPTTAIAALVSQAGPVSGQSSGVVITGAAGGTDADLYLNIRIDDNGAHMPEQVATGNFSADQDWTKGTGWTIAAGVATSDGSQEAVSDLSQTLATLEAGVSYKVTFTLTRTAGSVQPLLGDTAGTSRATSDTFTETIVAGVAGGDIVLRASADFEGTVDDVSVTPLTGTGTLDGTVSFAWINLGDIA
jgi:hypothetical protein